MSRQKKFINKTNIADYAIEAAARCFYPDIVAFYQSEEGQKEFAAWKAEQAALKQQKNERRATAEAVALAVILASSFVALLAWRREECGSHWGNTPVRNAGKKQIIRTHLPQGRIGSDYIGLVRATGLEPARLSQRNLNPPSLPIPPRPRVAYSRVILSWERGNVNGGQPEPLKFPGGKGQFSQFLLSLSLTFRQGACKIS